MELARSMVKEGELSLVKIGRHSFVQAEELDDFLRRKRDEPVLTPSRPENKTAGNERD
jgi:hypothetical protein